MKNKLSRFWEQIYPFLIGACIGFASWKFFKSRPLPEKLYDMMANGINIGGIAIGFLATTITLIFSLENNYVMRQLKNMGHFPTLMRFFYTTVVACLFLVAFGVIGFFLDFKDQSLATFSHIFLATWIGILVISGLCVYRFLRVICVILHTSHK